MYFAMRRCATATLSMTFPKETLVIGATFTFM